MHSEDLYSCLGPTADGRARGWNLPRSEAFQKSKGDRRCGERCEVRCVKAEAMAKVKCMQSFGLTLLQTFELWSAKRFDVSVGCRLRLNAGWEIEMNNANTGLVLSVCLSAIVSNYGLLLIFILHERGELSFGTP